MMEDGAAVLGKFVMTTAVVMSEPCSINVFLVLAAMLRKKVWAVLIVRPAMERLAKPTFVEIAEDGIIYAINNAMGKVVVIGAIVSTIVLIIFKIAMRKE
jgi:small-conductance mechanosensitive channel